MAQLHCNRWSDIVDCFNVFEALSCKIGDPHDPHFSIISKLVVTTSITINYSRANFFLKGIFSLYVQQLQGYLLWENLPPLIYTDKQSTISDYLLQCNCSINFDDISILATDYNKFKLIRESLLVKRGKPILNSTIKSFPLELVD